MYERIIICVILRKFLPSSRCNNPQQGEEGFSDSDWFLCFLFTTKPKLATSTLQLRSRLSYPAHPQYAQFIWAKQAEPKEDELAKFGDAIAVVLFQEMHRIWISYHLSAVFVKSFRCASSASSASLAPPAEFFVTHSKLAKLSKCAACLNDLRWVDFGLDWTSGQWAKFTLDFWVDIASLMSRKDKVTSGALGTLSKKRALKTP